MISDPLFYWFGQRYGDVAIRWMERKLGPGAAIVLWLERMFRKAALPVVAIVPNNWICLLAGASGMKWWTFATVNLTGTVVRVLGVRLIGDAFSDPILSFNDWIAENRMWLTVITFSLVFVFGGCARAPIERPTWPNEAESTSGRRADRLRHAEPRTTGGIGRGERAGRVTVRVDR